MHGLAVHSKYKINRFNVTEYKKFIHMVSDSTLNLYETIAVETTSVEF